MIADSYESINLFGLPLRTNKKDIYPRISSIIDTSRVYYKLTGTEYLQIFTTLRGVTQKHAIEKALNVVGLPFADKKKFSSYYLGMKQRLGIANAILNDPVLLILDEPINGLYSISLAEISLTADDIGSIHDGILLI